MEPEQKTLASESAIFDEQTDVSIMAAYNDSFRPRGSSASSTPNRLMNDSTRASRNTSRTKTRDFANGNASFPSENWYEEPAGGASIADTLTVRGCDTGAPCRLGLGRLFTKKKHFGFAVSQFVIDAFKSFFYRFHLLNVCSERASRNENS